MFTKAHSGLQFEPAKSNHALFINVCFYYNLPPMAEPR